MPILSEAKGAQSLSVAPRIKAFLAGDSGSGKTTSACSIPGKKLLIDFDNRADSLVGLADLDILPCHEADSKLPKAWERALAIKTELHALARKATPEAPFPYEAIIFDGLTSMGRIAMNWSLLLDPKKGLGGSPAQHHYGPQMNQLADYVLTALTLPCHIIFTGHIELFEEQTDEGTRHIFLPKITGKLKTEVANWFNECYLCRRVSVERDGKRITEHHWYTSGRDKLRFFKSSLNQLGKFWTDPIIIDFDQQPTGFAKLLELRFGKEGEKKEEKKEANQLTNLAAKTSKLAN